MAATQERELTVKEEKRLAKEQDRNYVDYRKQEILHLIKPKTKAFNLKKFDDEFPKPKKKDKIDMKFGEEMHKYLTLRPDARFATWPGKPAIKKKKPKAAAPVKTGLMAKMATAAGVAKPQKEATPEPAKKGLSRIIQKLSPKFSFKKPSSTTTWTAKTEAVRAKFFHNNAERARFFPFGPTAQLMTGQMLVFGNKCLVIGNTLQSIIESTADRKGLCKERVDKGHKPMVKWSKKTHTIEYVMDSVPLEKTAICEGKFQVILKENAKKE
ncbi:Protein CBG22113 [Caenorhabditis briggsae]|uniref:Protein CBG22113 n=1 Tax=Caenorhabditis briggsae TaxID=6238 RepID=A8Y1J8_CAEBR|nr:Protein CBG22113 [Caenorhabditis briggsae]CAP38768.2 Protein CBG22113 [Caenorhabditis briggsae]